jgi:ATP-dependent Clp protease ATP-binding subunit ClpA
VLSRNLEKSLHRSLAHANEREHKYATLEHLLLALTEDTDAIAVFRACDVDFRRLRRDVETYVNEYKDPISDEDAEPIAGPWLTLFQRVANITGRSRASSRNKVAIQDARPTSSFQRVLQRAAIHVQTSALEEVTGANVLVAMFAERESHAVYFLQE